MNEKGATALDVKSLIFVPALVTLGVTLVRLAGELLHGPRVLFNSEPGGAWAIVGIFWLAPIFGVYFALKLHARGLAPASGARGILALGLALIGMLMVILFSHVGSCMHIQQNFRGRLIYIWVIVALAVLVTIPGWPALFRVLSAYAYAARVPVAAVAFFAFWRDWGTHYDALPADLPDGLSWLIRYLWLGLFPQLIFWVSLTILVGMFFGSLAFLVIRGSRRPAEAYTCGRQEGIT